MNREINRDIKEKKLKTHVPYENYEPKYQWDMVLKHMKKCQDKEYTQTHLSQLGKKATKD